MCNSTNSTSTKQQGEVDINIDNSDKLDLVATLTHMNDEMMDINTDNDNAIQEKTECSIAGLEHSYCANNSHTTEDEGTIKHVEGSSTQNSDADNAADEHVHGINPNYINDMTVPSDEYNELVSDGNPLLLLAETAIISHTVEVVTSTMPNEEAAT